MVAHSRSSAASSEGGSREQTETNEGEPMSASYLQQKIDEYRRFFHDKLQPELQVAQELVRKTQFELKEYDDLKTRIDEMAHRRRQQQQQQAATTSDESASATKEQQEQHGIVEDEVDLGHGRIYCRAVVDEDVSTIYTHVGMGFHVELSFTEASAFVDRRLKYLRDDVLQRHNTKLAQVQDHCKSTERILEELDRELQRIGH